MSVSSGIFNLLFILVLYLFVQTTAIDEPLYYFCTDEQADIPYQTHTGQVLGTLYGQVPTYGYGAWSEGGVNAAIQCRGDVSAEQCLYCFLQTKDIMQTRCVASEGGLAYYDYCQFLYTNNGRWPGYDEYIYYCSAGDTVLGDDNWYIQLMDTVFSQLADRAYVDQRYMAAGYLDLGNSYTLYAYAQCHNFLSGDDCWTCIKRIGQIIRNTCARPYFGGRLVAGSCIIRYELYSFLNT